MRGVMVVTALMGEEVTGRIEVLLYTYDQREESLLCHLQINILVDKAIQNLHHNLKYCYVY